MQVPLANTLRWQLKLVPTAIPYFFNNLGPGYREFENNDYCLPLSSRAGELARFATG
jgi:hypothetical protein